MDSSKIFWVVCIGIIIWGVFFDSDDSGTSNSVPNNEMVTCPICYGSGRFNSPDLFKSQMPCTGCSGSGMVPASQVNSIIHLHTPTTPSSSSSGSRHNPPRERDCPHCYGSGVCNTCNGDGIYYGDYSLDPLSCPNCLSQSGSGRGRCQWCRGTGKRR